MVRYYGWYSNRARGERAKREAEAGCPGGHGRGRDRRVRVRESNSLSVDMTSRAALEFALLRYACCVMLY